MKKYGLISIVLLLLITSCSQVFEAGVSGRVVAMNGSSEQGVGGMYVYAYTDKDTYLSDLKKFKNGSITRPSEGSYIPATTTATNGDFTISKIVWETKKSMFGKTADVVDLYLIFYHEDYIPSGFGPVSIISGSTNASSVKQTVTQVRFNMPAFNSQIWNAEKSGTELDNVQLFLTDSSFEVFEGPGAEVYTHSNEQVLMSDVQYTHGHFEGLGAGLKYKGESIDVNIVWDVDESDTVSSGDLYYPVHVTHSTTGIPSQIVFVNTK